jgi:hypothetical protein
VQVASASAHCRPYPSPNRRDFAARSSFSAFFPCLALHPAANKANESWPTNSEFLMGGRSAHGLGRGRMFHVEPSQ